MHLTYQQKQLLIDHLSLRDHWRNTFSMAFFMADDRKGKSRNITPDINRFINDHGNKVIITHKTGAELNFDIQPGCVAISDESGHTLVIDADGMQSNWAKAAPLSVRTNNIVDIPGTRLAMFFDDTGKKFIIHNNAQIEFDAPPAGYAKPVQKGAQIHVASITHEAAQAWGVADAELADVTKLVVACDFGLETGIDAMNAPMGYTITSQAPETGNVRTLFPVTREVITLVQKPWNDTTEFEGHDVPKPATFFVECQDDGGLNVITSLDQREAILSQGDVMRAVLSNGDTPVQILSPRLDARQLLTLIARGNTVHDKRGREWSYMLAQTRDAVPITMKLRAAMRREFNLTARHCAVLTLENNLCVIALDARKIDDALAHSVTGRNDKWRNVISDAVQKVTVDARIQWAALRPF